MARSYPEPTTVLGEDGCWQLLAQAEVGRLAVSIHNIPEIFPLNFVIDNRTVLFRTAQGTKLASLAGSGRVAFEIDGFDPATGEAWSVVVHGTAEVLEQLNDVFAARSAAVPVGHHPETGVRPDQPAQSDRPPLRRHSRTSRGLTSR